MQLGLTIPLQRRQKLKRLPYGAPLDRCFCWDLHCILLHGRSCLLAVHCSTRYAFTLFDMTAADWAKLPETFLYGLRGSLAAAGVPETQIAAYLQLAGPPELTRTHGRREVAFLNRAWDDVAALDYTIDLTAQAQPLLDSAVNAVRCRCAGYEEIGTAAERLLRELALI